METREILEKLQRGEMTVAEAYSSEKCVKCV